MANRKLFIDGFDPDLIQGFEIDQIRPDAMPERVINAVRLALADGKKFIGSNFVDKRIVVTGHFYAGTRSAYEIGRDTLLGLFDPDRVVTMVFEQSGEDRRYYGTYENVVFDYKDNGTCIVTITYVATDPFGYTIAPTTFYNNPSVTNEITEVIESGGNIYGLPKFTINVNDIDNSALIRTFSLTISQGARVYNIRVARTFDLNDSITIDSARQKVFVNGIKAEYSGRWPQVLKTNTFRFNVLEAATFDVAIDSTYNKRWL